MLYLITYNHRRLDDPTLEDQYLTMWKAKRGLILTNKEYIMNINEILNSVNAVLEAEEKSINLLEGKRDEVSFLNTSLIVNEKEQSKLRDALSLVNNAIETASAHGRNSSALLGQKKVINDAIGTLATQHKGLVQGIIALKKEIASLEGGADVVSPASAITSVSKNTGFKVSLMEMARAHK